MPRWAQQQLAGWGRVYRAKCMVARPERWSELRDIFTERRHESLLARGAGRSYGDAALNSAGCCVLMNRLDRLLDFEPESGRLVAEAGLTFAELIAHFLPRGYMPPVVPGTGFATLGGGVANDVHGKNHHRVGSLAHHVEWLDLRLPSGEVRRVGPGQEPEIFRATVGGVGLTGIVERLCLRLQPVPSNAVSVEKRRVPDLEAYLEAFEREREGAEYVVGWIDALAKGRHLGRGVLETAQPAAQGLAVRRRRRPLRVPFDLPAFALSSATVRAFNMAYYGRVPPGGSRRHLAYEQFLFPLDALHEWNRIYGRRGFHQFQCVVPFEDGSTALRKMLELIASRGHGSFLAVLKAMGPAGLGYLSFPRPGYTLALDFPSGPGVAELIARLERIACDFGGRIYLAKDSTVSAENLRAMYPDIGRFEAVLAEIDPGGRMQSDLARRLRLGACAQ